MNTTERADRTLFYCDREIDQEGFERLFSTSGFPVVTQYVGSEVNFEDFGAIVHLAKSNQALIDLLGDGNRRILDEEYVLVAGNEHDLHCTVELTKWASPRLRIFVRSLWSSLSVP